MVEAGVRRVGTVVSGQWESRPQREGGDSVPSAPRRSALEKQKATLSHICVALGWRHTVQPRIAIWSRVSRNAAEESSRRRVVVRGATRDAAAARREAAAAQRGERARASADARALQGVLPPQDHAAVGAAGHQAVQAGHPAPRHLLHCAPATPHRRRRRP